MVTVLFYPVKQARNPFIACFALRSLVYFNVFAVMAALAYEYRITVVNHVYKLSPVIESLPGVLVRVKNKSVAAALVYNVALVYTV